MPLCSRCKIVKPAAEFRSYESRSGQILLKNPCADCLRRLTKKTKTRRRLLTAKRGAMIVST